MRHRRGMPQGEIEHGRDVLLVARGHDDHVGKDAQIGQVISAVMGGPVGADQAGAVEAEDDRQVLEGDLLEDLVVRPLQERAVDVDDRPGAGLGHAGGERHRVALADADVEELVGERVADLLELVSLAHGGGDHGDLGVAAARLEERVADGVGVRAARRRFERDDAVARPFETGPGRET